ncbi:MAG TPA: ester cyclase [Anaerolineales bacterium]|nr:ester cyclase [Anaerolineales bacterium]
MSAEENKALLRRYIEDVWDEQNPDAIDNYLLPNYKRHRSPTTAPLSREEQKQLLVQFQTVFSDIQITVEDVVAEDDRIAFRSTMRATHQGDFLGIPPTGKQITVGLVDLIRIENGKFVEQWGGPDLLDLTQQLGAEIVVKESK